MTIPIVIPDQRKVVESCVEQLYDLMLHYFDDKAIKNIGELDKQLIGLKDKYVKMYLEMEVNIPALLQVKRTRMLDVENPLSNALKQEQEDERVYLFRKMYQELLLLFKRKNDLSNEIGLGMDGN